MPLEHPPARGSTTRYHHLVSRLGTTSARSWRRVFAGALVGALALSACSADASVAIDNAAASSGEPAPAVSEADRVDAPDLDDLDDGGSEPNEATEGDAGDPPAEESEEPEATDDGDGATDAAQPNFEVQGQLPLEDDDVNDLIAFIETETGRPFLRPPTIVAQSADVFFSTLEEDLVDLDESADVTVRNLQALGLTTLGVTEVTDAIRGLLASPDGVQGYYDPEVDELYVPIDALGDDQFRSLLVHELTHALDDQYFDLSRLTELADEAEITGDFEPVIALQAVGEGRATAVQNRWMSANDVPLPNGTAADPLAFSRVPPAFVLGLSLPYAFGEQFIEGQGGPADTWDLFDDPPASSEEFLVPGTIGETIIDVPAPPADGPVLDEVVFGAADLFTWLLGESLEPDPSIIFPTFAAVDGWAGGRSVLWGDDNESCVRIALAADSTSDLDEMQSVLDTWAERGNDRSVIVEGDRVTVTSCAPYVP